MATEGPTTAGSIEAKLILDDSDFMAKLAAADAAARKLGSNDPNIRVDADTASAMAKLAAVDAATTRLGGASRNAAGGIAAVEAAQRKLAIANDALKLAYQRLDDIQTKGGASEARLMAAHLAATRAEEAHRGATNRLADAQLRLAAAEEVEEKAASNSNATHTGSIQRWQLIAGLIAALIPLMAPLAGYAVGVAGALAGMGAAGVLGIYGIVQAIKQATLAGEQYKTGLSSLKVTLDSLGNTAATAMLGAFKTAVATINSALPELNTEIRTFAQILGVAGNAILTGVVTALRVLNPLFVQASKYVLDLAKGFQAWTQDGGLQRFANYAMSQLPIVAQTLGSLAAAALHLVEALAPIGTLVLQGLTALGGAISAIPLPVLLDVAAGATAAFVAFKLWALISPILSTVATAIGAVGIATQIAEGPIGWITAGISALAAILAVSATASGQASQAAAEYAAALRDDNDAIGANVRATAAKQLQDAGALTAADRLGISAKTLTDATLGNKTAQDQVTEALRTQEDMLGRASGSTGALTAKQNEQAGAIVTVRDVMKDQSGQIQDQISKSKQLAGAIDTANQNTATSTDLITALKDATDAASQATDKFAKELAGLGQVNLSTSQANIQLQQSIADASAAIVANGKSLDITTEAGRKNMSALDNIASSAIQVESAQAKAGASTNDLTAQMAASRQAFINAAVAAGATADQANKLADQYGLIPANVSTAFHTSGLDEAAAKVQKLQQWIDNLHGKTVVVQARANAGVAGGPMEIFADGGTVTGSGGPKSDKVHAMVSPGEEIVSNPYAAQWRPALKLMNSGANKLQVAAAVSGIAGSRGSSPTVIQKTVNYYITETQNGQATAQLIDHHQAFQGV